MYISENQLSKLLEDMQGLKLYHSKEDLETTDNKEKFNKLFSKYLIGTIALKLKRASLIDDKEISKELISSKSVYNYFEEYLDVKNDIEIPSQLKERLKAITLTVEYLEFPDNDVFVAFSNRERNILNYVGWIEFRECRFNSRVFNLYSYIYYSKCKFNKDAYIRPYSSGDESHRYHYKNCLFSSKVTVTNSLFHTDINSNLFENCIFDGDIEFSSIRFNNNIFNYSKLEPNFKSDDKLKQFLEFKKYFKVNSLIIDNCSFKLSFKINGFSEEFINKLKDNGLVLNEESKNLFISNLKVLNSKFESKFEMKNRNVGKFELLNTNVEGIFDIFNSFICQASFIKCIFKDFAGFEEVSFGSVSNIKIKWKPCNLNEIADNSHLTVFKYVTFLDFSSFRGSIFKSGLEFSKTNLKDEPNFLNVEINENKTKRETFRIIKNSFEKSNNIIDANRFFVYEMKEYRQETKWLRNPFKRLILNANYWISGFGSNYIRPIVILLVSIVAYIHILKYQNEWVIKTINIIYMVAGDLAVSFFKTLTYYLNEGSKVIIPFNKLLEDKDGFEFISLLFFIWFGVLVWQTIVAVKRNTQH